MSKAEEYRQFLQSLRSSIGYWKSYAIAQFTISLSRILNHDGISEGKLAELAEMDLERVIVILRGGEDLTVETMVRLAFVLDSTVHIHVAKKGVSVEWVEHDKIEHSKETA